MKRQLDNIDIGLCISSVPIEGEEIVWEPLLQTEIFLVVPSKGHRYQARKISTCMK